MEKIAFGFYQNNFFGDYEIEQFVFSAGPCFVFQNDASGRLYQNVDDLHYSKIQQFCFFQAHSYNFFVDN